MNDYYLANRANGGSKNTVHTDPECRALKQAKNVRGPLEKDHPAIVTARRECKLCYGEAEQAEPTWGHYRALKAAAENNE